MDDWVEEWHDEYGRPYYYSESLNRSRWSPPKSLQVRGLAGYCFPVSAQCMSPHSYWVVRVLFSDGSVRFGSVLA